MLFLIVFLQIAGSMAYVLTEIEVYCGQLWLKGYNSCEITHNDQTIPYIGPEKKFVPGLKFGLITYKCDHTAGHLISEIDCTKCDFECSTEEYTESSACRDDSVQLWLGAILGLCFPVLIGVFLFKYLYKSLGRCSWFNDQFSRQKLSVFTAGENASDTTADVIGGASLKARTEQSYDQSDRKDTSPTNKNRRENLKSNTPSTKKTLASFFASILLIKTVKMCDVIYVMESDQVTMFCQDAVCSSVQPSSLTVQVGQEICVEDHFGERLSLRISEIVRRLRFELMYYTSNYSANKFNAIGNCCGGYSSCYGYKSRCYNMTIATVTDAYAEKSEKGWSCLSNWSMNMEIGCIYFGQKKREGELYPVFKMTLETWSVKVVANGTQNSQEVVLSNYNPTYGFVGYKLYKTDKVPITVLHVAERMLKEDSLIVYEEKGYFVRASEMNEPENDKFGDFQISLDKSKEKYSIPKDISCEPSGGNSCGCDCKFPVSDESMISKFARQKREFKQPDDYIIRGNGSVIDSFETLKEGRVAIRIGNWSIEDSRLQTAKCDVEFVASYGCTHCNESAYVVLKSSNIEREGMVPFLSNCSFDKQFIKCDFEPTKLVLRSNYSTCSVRMPTLDKNILIDMKYFNFGHKIKPKRRRNCTVVHASYGEALGHLVTSDRFIGTFVKTVVLSLISGLIMTVVFRVVQTRKYSNRLVKDTNLVIL